MKKVLHPNRWFIWCITSIVVVFIVVQWQVALFGVEQASYVVPTSSDFVQKVEGVLIMNGDWESEEYKKIDNLPRDVVSGATVAHITRGERIQGQEVNHTLIVNSGTSTARISLQEEGLEGRGAPTLIHVVIDLWDDTSKDWNACTKGSYTSRIATNEQFKVFLYKNNLVLTSKSSDVGDPSLNFFGICNLEKMVGVTWGSANNLVPLDIVENFGNDNFIKWVNDNIAPVQAVTIDKKNEIQNATITLSGITLLESVYSDFSAPLEIQQGTDVVLKWTSDNYVRGWGDEANVCLVGLDKKKEPIRLREMENLCYPDLEINLATTTVSSGEYHWVANSNLDKFKTAPVSYQLSVRVLDNLPEGGRSEWAGLIADSTSNEFVITPASTNK